MLYQSSKMDRCRHHRRHVMMDDEVPYLSKYLRPLNDTYV